MSRADRLLHPSALVATAIALGVTAVLGEAPPAWVAAGVVLATAVLAVVAPTAPRTPLLLVGVGAAAVVPALAPSEAWAPAAVAVVPVAALVVHGARVPAMVATVVVAVATGALADGDVRLGAVVGVLGVLAASEIVRRGEQRLHQSDRRHRRRLSDMSNLLHAADVLAALDDDDERATLTIGALGQELLGGDASAVVVRHDGTTRVLASRGEVELQGALRGAVERCAARTIGADTTTAVADDEALLDAGLTGLVGVPLRGRRGPFGAVVVAFHGELPRLDAMIGDVAGSFANQAGHALERLRSLQRIADAALRDPLTGVGNRRAIEAVLHNLRPGDAIAMLDLDHFKLVNDQEGHAAGDRLLVAFANHLRRSSGPKGVVGRWGGEEFVLVLPAAHHRAAPIVEEVAERWRESAPAATFSAGVALFARGVRVEELLEEADRALYAAKNAGRDRVVLSGDEVPALKEHQRW